MTRGVGVLALPIAAALCLTSSAGGSPAPQAEWTGRVLAARTHAPVPGAVVTDERAAAITDDRGAFRIVAEAGTRLRLAAPGFLDGFVELTDDIGPDLGALVLREAVTLLGRLVVEGVPLVGARVEAMVLEDREGDLPPPSAVSDDAGRFRVDGIDAETLRGLQVRWNGVVDEIDLGSMLAPLDAREYDLGAFELPATGEVVGRLVAAQGEPIGGARLLLVRNGGPSRDDGPVSSRSAADGSFTLTALPGRYHLYAHDPARPPVHRVVFVKGNTDLGDWSLPQPASTRGRVLDARGKPLAGVRVRVDIVGDIGIGVRAEPIAEVTSGSDGCYELPVAPRGVGVWVAANLEGYAGRGGRLQATLDSHQEDCEGLEAITLGDVGELRGTVVDADGRPMGATVKAQRLGTSLPRWSNSGESAKTEVNGEYRFHGLEVGDYEVVASSPRHRGVRASAFTVRAGEVETANLRLGAALPLHSLRVRVVDFAGVPVPDAEVRVERRNADQLDPPSPPPVRTGADGRARIDHVPAGPYNLAFHSRASNLRDTVNVDIVDDLPELQFRGAAQNLSLTTLAGRIVDADGRGVAGMAVELIGQERGLGQYRTFSGADGSFRFDATPPGPYALQAQRRGRASILLDQVVVIPASGMGDLLLLMPEPSTISIRVVGAEPEALTGMKLRWHRTSPIGEGQMFVQGFGVPDADGTFTIDNLGPGSWTIEAHAEGGRRVESTVEIERPGTATTATISFAGGATLSGIVTYREQPTSGWLVLGGFDSGESRRLALGPDGRFVVAGLSHGRYRVWVQGVPVELFKEELEVRGDIEIDLRVRGAAVSGTAIDAVTGQPVGGAHLRANPDPKWVWDAHREFHRTGADGTFAVGPFGTGPWLFEFSAPGYAKERLRLDLGDEDLANVRVPMRPTPGLNLRVVTPPGPLPGGLRFMWRDGTTAETFRPSAFPRSRGSLEVHLPDIALGPGLLTVSTQRPRYAARLAIDNDGSPVDVVLEPAGGMCLTVPELMESTVEATLRLTDPEGRPVQEMHGPDVWEISRSREFFDQALPAGAYEAVVTAADGRVWRGPIEIVAGKMNRVELR